MKEKQGQSRCLSDVVIPVGKETSQTGEVAAHAEKQGRDGQWHVKEDVGFFVAPLMKYDKVEELGGHNDAG